ncbi:hypothetical protein [Paenibacillus sp. KS-LC4]|uniref:CdiA C-terminal domain-containing protein n=1 Tax=Paenibacillus sp. KS-LC4 TaxID=2979727 RepID=UPI0030D1D661
MEKLLSEGLTSGKQMIIEGYNQADAWLNDMYADLEPTLIQGEQGFYNFSGGFIAAVDDAMFFGLAQHVVESNNEGSGMAKDTVGYQLGKVTGDTVMLVGGLIAMAGGVGGEIGGTALYATGFGALAGAPIQVASWGLLVGGGTVVVQSGKNIPGDVGDLFSNIWKSDSGPKGKGDIDVPKVDTGGTGKIDLTEPTLPPGGKPKGKYEKPDPNEPNPITFQNEAADLLASKGYDIEMLPNTKGGNGYGIKPASNPDFLINGKPFDCYSPETLKVRNIWATVVKKTEEQASRIVMNLDGYKGSLNELYEQFKKYEIPTLDELIIIKDGQMTRLKP